MPPSQDITNQESFRNAHKWIQEFERYASEKSLCLVVGCKSVRRRFHRLALGFLSRFHKLNHDFRIWNRAVSFERRRPPSFAINSICCISTRLQRSLQESITCLAKWERLSSRKSNVEDIEPLLLSHVRRQSRSGKRCGFYFPDAQEWIASRNSSLQIRHSYSVPFFFSCSLLLNAFLMYKSSWRLK
jgi:hypothetical protein